MLLIAWAQTPTEAISLLSEVHNATEVALSQSHPADYNHDGRPDLVVTQNGSFTHLYQNALARPGLRVRLHAGPANPTGVGAIARLKFSNGKLGPARLITAGSGYWSQDSAVQVLATPEPPTYLKIRWPNGKTTSTAIPQGAKEISVGTDGKLLTPAK